MKKSALNHQQLAWRARMVERDGWQQPAGYSDVDREFRALNEGLGVYDISPTGKLLLQGKDLGGLAGNVLPAGDAPEVGEVRPVSAPPAGQLARLSEDEYLVLCHARELPKWVAAMPEEPTGCVHSLDRTSGLAGLRLTGPKADRVLCQLSALDTSFEAFPNLRCAQTRCAEIHVTLIRADLGTLPSYDLYFPREFGEYFWDVIFEAGEEVGAAPVGFEAMERLPA